MTYSKFPSKAGVNKDDSPLEAELTWTDADKIRFVGGLPETIYGWERAAPSTLLGICRGAFTWADNSRNPYAAFGTHLRLYAMDIDGNISDITPVVSGPTNSVITYATQAGSATVTASGWTHGLAANQKFSLSTVTIGTLGGVTLAGTFVVDDPVVSTTSLTFTAAQTASSTAGPTGSTTQVSTYLAPGQIDGLGGLGFGTGGYASGGYGGGSSGLTLYPRTWSLAPWGQDLLANPRGGAIYEAAPGGFLVAKVANAPTQCGSMFVTAERILVACGSNLDGAFDALQIDWSDAEDNTDWTPTAANLAGGYTLPDGGRVVRGMPGVGENVIWTEDKLWSMRYNADPNRVYDFISKGAGCGLMGPNAAAEVNGVWYWMTPAGAFMAYGGAAPALLPCTLARDVKDNLAFVQQDKVYAARLVGKNYAEVWWFYPDLRDGNECSRYVIYDTIAGAWSCGRFDRTAFVDASVFQYPLAVDAAGAIWFHEKGFTQDGGPRGWSLMGAYRSVEGGQIIVNGVRPDHDDLQGGYAVSFSAKNRDVRGIFARTYPALNITAATGQRAARVQGEQVSIGFAGNAAPSFWRMGNMQFDLTLSERKR